MSLYPVLTLSISPTKVRSALYIMFCQLCFLSQAHAQGADLDIPWASFTATTLADKKVESSQLVGQPTLLMITPSKAAGDSTKAWGAALEDKLDDKRIRIRSVLTIDLPFFMSESDAISHAKEVIPERYYDKTWLLDSQIMEEALDIRSDSKSAIILVIDAGGTIIARVHGQLTDRRLAVIVTAVESMQ